MTNVFNVLRVTEYQKISPQNCDYRLISLEDKQGEFDEMPFRLGGMTLNFLDVIGK